MASQNTRLVSWNDDEDEEEYRRGGVDVDENMSVQQIRQKQQSMLEGL